MTSQRCLLQQGPVFMDIADSNSFCSFFVCAGSLEMHSLPILYMQHFYFLVTITALSLLIFPATKGQNCLQHTVWWWLSHFITLLKYCLRCYSVLLMNSPKALYLMGLHLNKSVKILFAWVFVFCPPDAFLEVLEGGYSCFAARGKAPFRLGKYGWLDLRFCLISVHSTLP